MLIVLTVSRADTWGRLLLALEAPYPPHHRSCRPRGHDHRVCGLVATVEGRMMSACQNPGSHNQTESRAWRLARELEALLGSSAPNSLGEVGSWPKKASGGKMRLPLPTFAVSPRVQVWLQHYCEEGILFSATEPAGRRGREPGWDPALFTLIKCLFQRKYPLLISTLTESQCTLGSC